MGALLLQLAHHWPLCCFTGLEHDSSTAARARANIRSAGLLDKMRLRVCDATAMPLPDNCIDVVVSDLPFGRQHGSLAINAELYPRLLSEIARVMRPAGRATLLTSAESSGFLLSGAVSVGLQVVSEVPLLFGGSFDKRRCTLVCLGREASAGRSAFDLPAVEEEVI